MRQWLASQGFGSVMIAVWSLYVMFVFAAWAFGFDEVTEAVGGAMDRIGLTVSEARE